jgi:hypothetical protein
MAQHFLLSTAARTLGLAKVMRLSDEDAFQAFKSIRWTANDGDPICPCCGCVSIYFLSDNRRFKCGGCGHKFSVSSGTIFASRKMAIRDILAAIAIFVNGAKGPQRAPTEPRSGLPVQDGLRSLAQDQGSPGR